MIFIRRLLLLGASWAASFVSGLDNAPSVERQLYNEEEVYADERQRRTIICRRPVGQQGYSHKALSLIREWRPLNRERRRSALSLGDMGHGA